MGIATGEEDKDRCESIQKGGHRMSGEEVRALIVGSGLSLWKVAEKFGCTPQWYSVRLRHDFTDEEAERLQAIIKELQAE